MISKDVADMAFEFPSTGMVRYLFPLRPDVTVTLVIPRNLTIREHDRLVRFLESLTMAETSE